MLVLNNAQVKIEQIRNGIVYKVKDDVIPQRECYSVFTPLDKQLDLKDLSYILNLEHVTRIVFEDNPNIDSNVYRVEIDNNIDEQTWDNVVLDIAKYLGIDDSAEHMEEYYNEFMWNWYMAENKE